LKLLSNFFVPSKSGKEQTLVKGEVEGILLLFLTLPLAYNKRIQ
jgi:hypothetical protein